MNEIWQVRATPEGIVGEILGYITGLIISLLFLRLIQRTPRSEPGSLSRLAFSLCAIAFNISGLIHKALMLTGASPYIPALRTTNFLLFAIAAVWPTIGLHLWSAAIEKNERSSFFQKWLSPISTGCSSALVAWLAAETFQKDPYAHQTVIQDAGLYYACGIMLISLFLFWKKFSLTHASRWSLSLSVGGILGATLITQLLHLKFWPDSWIAILVFLKQQLVLFAIFGALFLFARLRFTDVFVRNALRVFTAELGAFLLWMIARRVLPHTAAEFAPFQNLIFLCGVGALLLAAMQTDRFLNWFVGHALFHEPDYRQSVKTLWQKLIALEKESMVMETASDEVTHILELEKAAVLPLSSFPEQLVKLEWFSGEAYELPAEQESEPLIHGHRVDLLIPVRVHGKIAHLLAIASGPNRRSLLRSEVNYLRNIANLVGSRIEVLQLESQRLEQASRESKILHQLTEAELRALRAQINPHFLFNAFNMLAELIRTVPERAEEVTLRLSSVFRHVLRNSEKNVYPIQEEIDFLRAYLSIEEARLEENLQVSIDLDPAVAQEPIPSLLLQPIVENAIRHGLAPKLGPGWLHISVRGENGRILLSVEDNGIGTPRKQQSGNGEQALPNGSHGVGLKNTVERLRTFYNGRASLSFQSEPDAGSRVIISIPQRVKEYANLTQPDRG